MPSSSSPKGILVEGVECSGKTTLIKRIRDELMPWDCKFLSHQRGHQFERYMYEYLQNKNIIFNRGHFSEVVYSRVFGREAPFQCHELRVLNEYVARNLILVLCEADIATLITRYSERKYFQKAPKTDLQKIKALFRDTIEHLDCIQYNSIDETSMKNVVAAIKNRIAS